MNELEVTSIQRGCVDDGEGVRTVIFFRGCPFSCPWCCNPETIYLSKRHFINEQKCLKQRGEWSSLCIACERYGGLRRIEDCPFGVCTSVSHFYSTEELFVEVMKDKTLYEQSGGGVTLSGGDPILQLDNLLGLLSELHREKISCAIETTLYSRNLKNSFQSIKYIDEWIVDLKLQQENWKRDYVTVVKENLNLLRKDNKRLRFRLVYIDGLPAELVVDILNELEVDTLEVLKCHALSNRKYEQLGIEFKSYVPTEENYNKFLLILANRSIHVIPKKI